MKGVVTIGGDLYVKTPRALKMVLRKLRQIGYTVDNLRDAEHRDNVSVETMEKNGSSLWYAHLDDVRRGKCVSCNGLIDTAGIRSHGHTCELCGNVTYYHIIDGSHMRFTFIPRDGEARGMADITMDAKRWDTEEGFLYLYRDTLKGGLWLRDERAEEYLSHNKAKWEEVEEEGRKLIKLRYPLEWDPAVSAINPTDITGHFFNHTIVSVWDGKEYSAWSRDFPLPESMSIWEAWHWAPLEPTPTLHERIISSVGMVSRQDYYYQDGRPAFNRTHFAEMAKFIRHFTILSGARWDEESDRFHLDGPGAIADIAKFCHPSPEIENSPNSGNLIHGFGKLMSGETLTRGETDAMVLAASDDKNVDLIVDVLKGIAER